MNKAPHKYYFSIGILLAILVFSFSCREKPTKIIEEKASENKAIYLLSGEWEMKKDINEPEYSYVEKWTKVSDNRLNGNSSVINKKQDVEFTKANLSIYLENEKWKYYLNYGQKSGIILTETKIEPNLIRFEQEGKIYPQFIQYKLETKNKIIVEMGDKNKTQSYELKRKRFL